VARIFNLLNRGFPERGCIEDQPQLRSTSKLLKPFNHAICPTLAATGFQHRRAPVHGEESAKQQSATLRYDGTP
jgi:hypothetical protein